MPVSASNVSPFIVHLTFYGDLDFFLKSANVRSIERYLKERTSIKDVIESCGIPHPEVDLILVDSQPVGFDHVISKMSKVSIYPVSWHRDTFFADDRLQVLKIKRFVADVHLGKLTRNLRLLGLDISYDPTIEDPQLLKLAQVGDRTLLTRDRRLLMHAVVSHGYYLRSQEPIEQTIEVLRRFHLSPALAPFTRCLRCNTLVEAIEKTEIIHELEPLTKIYYEQFRRCPGCGQIYWPGSHFKKLEARIAHLRQRLIFGLRNPPKSG